MRVRTTLILTASSISCSAAFAVPFPVVAFSASAKATASHIVEYAPSQDTEGAPVKSCPTDFKDGLKKNGVATSFDTGMSVPKVIEHIDAKPSEEALAEAKRHHGSLIKEIGVGLVVDKSGTPRDLCVSQSAGSGLDELAVEAVRQWKFKPAVIHGQPVPFRTFVRIQFHLGK